jgi:stalled ribosome rescue protein Dom34
LSKGRRPKRGYPVAVLVGFEERRAVLWRVFSEVAKLDSTIAREQGDALYDFHESIVNALRPAFKEGIRSIVVAAPARTDHTRDFLNHVRKHHAWLVREGPNAASFGEIVGSAGQPHEIHELVRTKEFRDVISETRSRDAENITALLNRSLNMDSCETILSYSLEEIEDLVYGRRAQSGPRPEQIALTDRYLTESRNKSRIQRLLQIAKNQGVKTTIVNAETGPGLRLTQLGGLACLANPESNRKR